MPGENLALASRNDQQTLHTLVTVRQGTTHSYLYEPFLQSLSQPENMATSHYEHYHEYLKTDGYERK